jgi:hypothetical protein
VLDHFKCYEADQVGHRFHPRSVVLRDQFGTEKVQVVEPETFCPPVSKNGSEILHPDAHLTCYSVNNRHDDDIRGEHGKKPLRVVSIDQFGRHFLTLERTKALCLPSSKTLPGGHPTHPPRGLDHFKCYDADQFGHRFHSRWVVLRDQFGVERVRALRPETFCTPVSKNGSRILHREAHLTCYVVAGHRGDDDDHHGDGEANGRRVIATDQFGRHFLRLERTGSLCLPSTKIVLRR